MKRVAVLACVGLGIWAGISTASTRPHWVATELGTLSFPQPVTGLDSAAIAIGPRGEVLGESGILTSPVTGAAPLRHAFVWKGGGGRMVDLGTLGGSVTDGVAVNGEGSVVGSSTTRAGATHAFLWRDGKLTGLGTLGGRTSAAVGINDRNQVIGWSDTSTGSSPQHHAFLWERGRIVDLGTLGGAQSEPLDINARGQIVGWSDTRTPGHQHAFLWQNGKMTDLGTLGGDSSEATAINDRGQVIGDSSNRSGHETSFLWNNGKMRPFSALGPNTHLAAINNRGEILGQTAPAPGGGGRILVWQNGKRRDLGCCIAEGINDHGDVVARTNGPSGIGQAILWQSGQRIVLGTVPGGSNNPNDGVEGDMAVDPEGTEVVATHVRSDHHTRAIVWRRK